MFSASTLYVYGPLVSHSGVMESCATIRKGCYYDLCSLSICLLLAGFYKYKMAIIVEHCI